MNTKLILLAGLVTGFALQLCPTAMAGNLTVTESASPGEVIPDDNLSGIISAIAVSSSAAEGMTIIDNVSLTLDITGATTAYNGDFYAYLVSPTGQSLTLLNSIDGPGSTPNLTYGSPGNGMNVTLSDGHPTIFDAPSSVNTSLSGTYSAQGGSLNSKFGGYTSPAGDWTLFIADTSAGGVGELAGWSLTVVGTPDNGSTILLLAMGVGLLGLFSMRQPRTVKISRK